MNVSKRSVCAWKRKIIPASALGCSARRSRISRDTSTPAGQAVRHDLQLRQASTTRCEFRQLYCLSVTISNHPRELMSSDRNTSYTGHTALHLAQVAQDFDNRV